MQAHGQEEMFMGCNQVGRSSNPGKCDSVVMYYHISQSTDWNKLVDICTQREAASFKIAQSDASAFQPSHLMITLLLIIIEQCIYTQKRIVLNTIIYSFNTIPSCFGGRQFLVLHQHHNFKKVIQLLHYKHLNYNGPCNLKMLSLAVQHLIHQPDCFRGVQLRSFKSESTDFTYIIQPSYLA